ncbi:hypothetical protein ACLOJK_039224, partial [Asimina triloba]
MSRKSQVEAGHPTQPQLEERSLPYNAVVIRSLPVIDVPLPEDRAPLNLYPVTIYPLSQRPLTIGCQGADPEHGPSCTSSPGHLSASPVYTEGAGREQLTSHPPPCVAHLQH